MPPERPRGRSSILKPPKVRNPLSDLDKKQNVDDDGTTFDRNKRVSFSNTQGIALFRHTVHGNTIWDNFFEEPHKPDNSENSDIGSSLIRKMEASTNLLKASCSTQNTMDDLDEIKKQILSGDNNSYDNIDISFTPASEHDMTFATNNESGSINDDDDCCVNMGYHKPSTKRISDIVLELTNPSLVDQTEALINYKINDNNTLSGTNKFDKNMDLSFKDNMDKLISSIENENVKKIHTEMNENDPLTTDDSEMSITQGIAMPIEETVSSVVKPKQILMHSFVYSNVMEKKQNWIEDKENILIPVAVIDRLETESDCKSRLSIPHNQSVNNEEVFIDSLRNSNKMCNDMQIENQIIESKKCESISLISGIMNCADKENQDENIDLKRENVGCDLTTDSRILQHESNKQKIVFDQNVDYDMFLMDVDVKKDGNRFFNSTAYPTFKNNETLNTINDPNCIMDLNESKPVNIINAKLGHSLVSESNTTSLINVANLKKQISIEKNYNYDDKGSALTDAPQSKIVGEQEEIRKVIDQTKNEEENSKINNSEPKMIVEDKHSDRNIPHSINKNIEEQAIGQKMDYDEIQIIEAVEINKKSEKRKTIIFDQADSNCNMSITLAAPLTLENKENLHNIIINNIKQRETVVFDQCASECKTSMTSIKNNDKEVKEQTFTSGEKKTIHYPDDSNCNMSMTLPILNDERKKSFIAQNSAKDKSLTNNFLPQTEIHKKRQTIVFDQQSPDGEMSITCDVPSNNNLFNKDDPLADIRREKRKTIIFNPEDTNCNMSMTMAVPSNHIDESFNPKSQQRRETVFFDRQNSNYEMSMTCMVPSAKLLSSSLNENTRPNIIIDKQTDFTFLKAEFNKKRTTVVFDQNNKESDMSMTSVMSSNRDGEETRENRKSIIHDQNSPNCNTSVIVPLTMIISNENRIDEVPFDSNENGDRRSSNKKIDDKNHTVNIDQSGKICEKSMTLFVPMQNSINCGIEEKNCLLKRSSVINDQHNPNCEMSITSTVPSNKEKYDMTLDDLITDIRSEKRKTIIYNPEDSNCNMSMTSAVPSKLKNDEFKETVMINEPLINLNPNGEISITSIVPTNDNFLITDDHLADIKREKRKTIIFNPEDTKCNMSMTVAVASNCKNDDLITDIRSEKRKTIIYNLEDSNCNMSMTSAVPSNFKNDEFKETVTINEPLKNLNPNGEISITSIVPTNDNFLITDDHLADIKREKRKTIIFNPEDTKCNMSMTVAVASNCKNDDLITDIRSEKRKTIIYNSEDSNCNMSMTSAVPSNFKNDEFKETVTINEPLKNLNPNGEISITSIVPTNDNFLITDDHLANIKKEKRKTIIFNPEDTKCNMSMTVAVASNCKNDEYKAVTINEPLNDIDIAPELQQRRETVFFDQQNSNCEMPSIIPPTKFLNENSELNIINGNNVFDQDKMSMIGAMSSNKDVEEMDCGDILDKEKSETFNQANPSCNTSVIVPLCVNISNDNVNHISFLDNASTERHDNKRHTGNFDEIGKICDTLTTKNTSIEQENCKLKEQANASFTNNTFIAANVFNDISQTVESTPKRPSVLFNQINPDCGISTPSEMKTESDQHFIARFDEIDFEPINDRIDNKENISKMIVFDQKHDRSDTSISLALENNGKREAINVQKSELPVNNSISLNLRVNQTKETLLLDRQYCELSMTSIIPHVNDRSIIKPFFGGKSNMSAVKNNITDYNLEDNCNMSISMQTSWKYKKDDNMTIDDYMQDVEMPTVSDLSSKLDIEQLKESSVFDPENPNGETSISSIVPPAKTIESKHDDVDIPVLKEVASDIIEEKRQSVIYDQDNLVHNMSIDMCSPTKIDDDAKNIISNDVKMNCLSPNLSIQSEACNRSSSICEVKEPVLDNELLAKDCEDKEIADQSAQLIISSKLNEKEDDENHGNYDILLKNSPVLIIEKQLRRSTVVFDQDSPNYKTPADSGYENSSNVVISSDINESNSSSTSENSIDERSRISNESTHNIVEVVQLPSTLQENISSNDIYVNDECSENKLKDLIDEQSSLTKLNERRISMVESQKLTEIQPIIDIQDVDLIGNEVKTNEELSLQDNSISSSNLLEESIAIVVDDMKDHRDNSYLGSPSKIDALKNRNDKSISSHDLSLNASNISKYAAESDNLNDDQPMEIEMSDNRVDIDTINYQNSFINNSKSDMVTENIESHCHTEDNCESSIYNKKCDKSQLQNSKDETQISGFKEINMSDAVKETILDDKNNETIATNASLNAQSVDAELNTIQLINLKTFTCLDGSITNKLNESIPKNPNDNNDGLGSPFNRNESLKENNISTNSVNNSNGQLNTSDKRKYSESDLGDEGDDNVSIKKPKLSFSVCQWIKDISKNVNESSNQFNITQNINDNRNTSTEQIYTDRSPKSDEEISKMLENISDMSLVESSMDNMKESNNSDSQNIIQNTSESDSNTAISNQIMNNHDQNKSDEFDVSIVKNEDEKKTQLNDLVDNIKSANVCDCIPEEFSENEWRFLFLNGTMRLKIKFQNCDNMCATKMPISNIYLERLVARDPVSEEYYMCIAVINQIKSRNLIALCSNLGDVENLLMHCSTICSEAKRWNQMLEILYLMYGLEANNDNKFTFRIASGRLRCIWQVEVKMNCLPYADKKDIEMHVVAGKSPIKNREFLNIIENIDLNWSFLRNLTDDLHKLVRTFETD